MRFRIADAGGRRCPRAEPARVEVNTRSDSALSHPNPVAIEARCRPPPSPARRGAPPNAAPNSTNTLVIAIAEPGRIRSPAILPTAHGERGGGQSRDRDPGEDRDRAKVMQCSLATGHDRWRREQPGRDRVSTAGIQPLGRSRTVQSRSVRAPAAKISVGTARGAAGLLRAPREAVSRDAKERARGDEVGTLQPAITGRPRGTHCVTPPVVPSASRPDCGEGT